MIRKIMFGEFDSLQAGLRISSERSSTSGGEQRVSSDTIAYRDGDIRYPTGQETARLTYCFVLREGSRAANEAKAKAVINALKGRRGDFADSDLPGKVYKNAVFESAEPLEYVSRSFAAAYMTVVFAADPVPEPAGAVNKCVLQFSVRGGAYMHFRLDIIDQQPVYSFYVTEGSTSGGELIVDKEVDVDYPFMFRIEAISENVPQILINGTTSVDAKQVFQLYPGGTIAITHTGWGFYEIWFDTREVSP